MTRSCILRTAALPIRLWQQAANPPLFAAIRVLAALRLHHAAASRALADDIGRELVCAAGIARADRNLALDLRRRLYNGRPLGPREDLLRIAGVAATARLDAESWRERLHTATEASQRIAELDGWIDATVRDEPARLAEVAWTTCRDVPAVRRLMMHRNPELLRNLDERAARGEPWGSKSARQSSEYVWRVLQRAATKSNPRDWHGHVGLLSVDERASTGGPRCVSGGVFVQWIENAHRQRRNLVQASISTGSRVRLSVTPLHWRTEQHSWAWAVDREQPQRLVEVQLRRTAFLDEIYDAASAGSVPFHELAAMVLDDPTDPESRALLCGFVEHLVGLGLLELSSTPRSWMVGPLSIAADPAGATAIDEQLRAAAPVGSPLDEARDEGAFLDVYRSLSGSLPLAEALRLQRLFSQVQRLLSLIDDDQHPRRSQGSRMDQERAPISLLETIRARVLAPPAPVDRERPFEQHWPPARSEDSGYGRLLAWIASRADHAKPVDIDARRLDELAAAVGSFDWPVDCVLRLPAASAAQGVVAVLDEAFPAGTLDARFVGALRHAHGEVPHADDYQRFLQRLEEITGVTILELLIPPLSLGAANATKRPLLTRAFTGDGDVGMYIEGARSDTLEYVPLGAITLRRSGRGTVVEAEGRRVWPIYHSTRRPLPPWSTVANVLLAASPLSTSWRPRRLHFSLDAFPERRFMPRITVGGGLVVAGAQWRLTEHPWDRRAPLRARLDGLERLRSRLGLPRWVFVAAGWLRKPVACDLESILAVRVLEDAIGHAGGALLVEMVPDPHELLVVDHACLPPDRCVSSVMLRFPYDEAPLAMAERIATRLRESAGD